MGWLLPCPACGEMAEGMLGTAGAVDEDEFWLDGLALSLRR